ncbi:hypothetical protein [Clostridium sardiniense]|uniref:hypothetical protein n=1 Tax=Clostridium sardiniense TaxID=29369 RepID=UPI0019597855|nr:hypothetical protein [Clostridium sardiniense]MBM7836350.1 hypothetical protein [Clostridium sardiniense]
MNHNEIKNLNSKDTDIKNIEFIFENNESTKVPKSSIKHFSIVDGDLKCNVVLNSDIEYEDISRRCKTPLERINSLNDITQLKITTMNNEELEINIGWYDREADNPYYMPMNNELQTSKMLSWNEIELNILDNKIHRAVT